MRELLTSNTESFDGSDLSAVIARCHALSKKDVAGQFLSMLSSIQLAFKCQECMRPLMTLTFGRLFGDDTSILVPCSSFYYTHIQHLPGAPALRTFQEWIACGAKFTRIAARGSVYSLLILTGLNLHWPVGKAHGNVPFDVATMLRRPRGTESGKFSSILCSSGLN